MKYKKLILLFLLIGTLLVGGCEVPEQTTEEKITEDKALVKEQEPGKCYHTIYTSEEVSCELTEKYKDVDMDVCLEAKNIIWDSHFENAPADYKEKYIDLSNYCVNKKECYHLFTGEKAPCIIADDYVGYGVSINLCENYKKMVEENEFSINQDVVLRIVDFCYGKGTVTEKKEYKIEVNILEPKTNYDCNSLNPSETPENIINICKYRNWCDKIEPYDMQVRKSASEAIVNHKGAYSTNQILDIYDWAKNNIFYQNVPLNEFPPYRPSETIFTGSGDCKNYAVVIASMILSIGGQARTASPSCRHAFAEVFIGGEEQLDSLKKEMKQRYQQDMEINVIKDEKGYWFILDGAGANYPGTTEITECLNENNIRYQIYSCVKSDGTINKKTYEKKEETWSFTDECASCSTVSDCQSSCEAYCIGYGWEGSKSTTGYEETKYLGLQKEIYCNCNCFKYIFEDTG